MSFSHLQPLLLLLLLGGAALCRGPEAICCSSLAGHALEHTGSAQWCNGAPLQAAEMLGLQEYEEALYLCALMPPEQASLPHCPNASNGPGRPCSRPAGPPGRPCLLLLAARLSAVHIAFRRMHAALHSAVLC